MRILLIGVLALTGLDAGEVPGHKRTLTVGADSAAQLAESGHCREALPLLKQVLARAADPGQKRRLGLDAVRCAINLNDTDSAADFVRALKKQFPRDPEVLYVAVHVFSDLSVRSSQELSAIAPVLTRCTSSMPKRWKRRASRRTLSGNTARC